jgi:hypothetical protein
MDIAWKTMKTKPPCKNRFLNAWYLKPMQVMFYVIWTFVLWVIGPILERLRKKNRSS